MDREMAVKGECDAIGILIEIKGPSKYTRNFL